MRGIFQQIKSSHLRGSLIWLPMLPDDSQQAATARELEFANPRLTQYWDGECALGKYLAQPLGLEAPVAWDVYLLYHPGSTSLSAPDFWMHQQDEQPDHFLDARKLLVEVRRAARQPGFLERFLRRFS